jgi:hypothetical protein
VDAQFSVNIPLCDDSVGLVLGICGCPRSVLAEFLRQILAIEEFVADFPATF